MSGADDDGHSRFSPKFQESMEKYMKKVLQNYENIRGTKLLLD